MPETRRAAWFLRIELKETGAKGRKKPLFKDLPLSSFLHELDHRFSKRSQRPVQDPAPAAGGKTRGRCPIFFGSPDQKC